MYSYIYTSFFLHISPLIYLWFIDFEFPLLAYLCIDLRCCDFEYVISFRIDIFGTRTVISYVNCLRPRALHMPGLCI